MSSDLYVLSPNATSQCPRRLICFDTIWLSNPFSFWASFLVRHFSFQIEWCHCPNVFKNEGRSKYASHLILFTSASSRWSWRYFLYPFRSSTLWKSGHSDERLRYSFQIEVWISWRKRPKDMSRHWEVPFPDFLLCYVWGFKLNKVKWPLDLWDTDFLFVSPRFSWQ